LTRLIHFRGDFAGMFLFLLALLIGLWQIVVAWKHLNSLSVTGYPDRRWASYTLGATIIIASCAWYFSGKGHFASPDLEGVETLLVLALALAGATIVQCVMAKLAGLARALIQRSRDARAAD